LDDAIEEDRTNPFWGAEEVEVEIEESTPEA
jgi:hypothetical protein